MSLESCIFGCTDDAAVYGCRWHWPVHPADPQKHFLTLLSRIITNQEKIMTALDNLQAADTALKAEVTQAITDWASQLASAGANDPAVQAVADDMNNMAAQLQTADAATGTTTTPPVTPPAS